MDSAAFLVRYPEFENSADELIEAALAEALLSLNECVYGSKRDAAQGALAAHLLWTGPTGVTLRLDGDKPSNEKSRYWQEYVRLRREVAPRFLVT